MNDVEPFSKSNRGQYSSVSKEEAMQMYERSLIAEETRVLKDVNLPFYIGDLAQQGLLAPHHVRGLIYTLKYGRMEFQSTPRHFLHTIRRKWQTYRIDVIMKRIIIFLTICIFGAISEKLLYAQSNNTDTPIEILSINGLEVGGKYTREQIFAALGGQPDRIIQSEDDPGFFEYYYDKDVFFQMDDEFYGGSIVSSRFYITEGIRVGDSIEAINQLKGICTAGEYAKSRYAGGVRWKPIKNDTWDWQVVNFYYNSQGEIAGVEIYVYYY